MGGASGIWRRREAWRILGPILAVGVTATSAHAQCQYDVTIIQAPVCPPPLPEPAATFATALNDFGEVVGYHRQCDELTLDEAFVWSPETGLVTLDRPTGFVGARANDINDIGDIVGSLRTNNRFRGALWQGDQVVDLGIPPAGNFSMASAVNNQSQVVGHWGNSVTGKPALQAFLWEDGVMANVELPVGPNSDATAINDLGQITGWMGQSFLIDSHAYVWDDGSVADLGVIPGGFTSGGESINGRQQVVGFGQVPAEGLPFGVAHAFYWEDGEMLELDSLPGLERCFAVAINDAQQVVGVCSQLDNPGVVVPFIWQNGVMTNLTDLIADDGGLQLLSHVSSINNSGQITGWGIGPDAFGVAALLTPVNSSPADVNNDCAVNVVDLIELLLCFGEPAGPPCHLADVNDDGVVNVLDLIILLLNFGS